MSEETGGWKRYLFGRDGTARVVAALVLFLIGYFLILSARLPIPFISPETYGIIIWIPEWLDMWQLYAIAYSGIAIALSSQFLYLVSIPVYRSREESSTPTNISAVIRFLLPITVIVVTGAIGVNIYGREPFSPPPGGDSLFIPPLFVPSLGAAYLFYLLNELYFRVVSGDEPTEREKNQIMSETKSRLRRSMLVMLAGLLLLPLFTLYVAPSYGENSAYPKSPNWGVAFGMYTVVGVILATQSWYVICKPFCLTYSRKEGGNYETKRKITKAIPFIVFGLAILEFAVARAGLLKYVLVSTYSLAGAISFSFPFQLLGFVFIYRSVRKWIVGGP